MRNPVDLHRLHYWQGQRLKSQDVHDQAAIDDEYRWWHNRAMHDAYGVSIGLTVTPISEAALTIRQMCVTKGLAYDCFGRELLLKQDEAFDLPQNLKEDWTLLIRYREEAEFPRYNHAADLCLPSDHNSQLVVLVWKLTDNVTLVDGVPLARLKPQTAGAAKAINDIEVTVNKDTLLLSPASVLARGLSRPLIASGTTIAGRTPWQPWSVPFSFLRGVTQNLNLGVQVKVDTSAVGFIHTPLYFAWLQSARPDEPFPLFVSINQIADSTVNSFVFRLATLAAPFAAPQGSILDGRMFTPNLSDAFMKKFMAAASEFELFVSWIGIQCDSAEGVETDEHH